MSTWRSSQVLCRSSCSLIAFSPFRSAATSSWMESLRNSSAILSSSARFVSSWLGTSDSLPKYSAASRRNNDRRIQSDNSLWLFPNCLIEPAACISNRIASASRCSISFSTQNTSCHCLHFWTSRRCCLAPGSSTNHNCCLIGRICAGGRDQFRKMSWKACLAVLPILDDVFGLLIVKMFKAEASSKRSENSCTVFGGSHGEVASFEVRLYKDDTERLGGLS